MPFTFLLSTFFCTFAADMSSEAPLINWKPIIRRWIYMAAAIIASAVLMQRPVFNFQDDKGIIYVRSYEIDTYRVSVVHTRLDNGLKEVADSTSIAGLHYCNLVMLWGSVLCLLAFFSKRWQTYIALFTAIAAGVYYALMIFYAMRISDAMFATLYPNIMAVLPAVVCQMMILTRHNIIHERIDEDERSTEE